MTLNIRTKIILIVTSVSVIAIGADTLFENIFFAKEYSKALQSETFAIGHTLKSQLDRLLRLKIPIENLVGFEEQCQEVINKYPNISYAMVVDSDGRILFHNDTSQHGQVITDPTIFSGIKSQKDNLQVYFREGEKFYDFIIPLTGLYDERIGALRIGFPAKLISQKTRRIFTYSVGFNLIFLAIGLGLLIISLNMWVTKPLGRLITVIEEIRRKGTDSPQSVQIYSRDEIGQLATVFNQMILEIRDSHAKIKDHTEALEAKVQQRTVKLRTAVEKLKRDIIERRRVERELRNSREQLQNLSAYLQSAREQERASIAREIHDDLGQILTALKMDLSWLGKRLAEDQEPLIKKARSMSRVIEGAMKTIKRLSADLRPRILDDLGLTAAIEWQAEQFQIRTGAKCELIIDLEDSNLDPETATALFRIFQETLTNVARHANATTVWVDLRENKGEIKLRVEDNGKGIEESKIFHPKSFGLLGIRERVNILGGDLKIESIPDKGTTVMVSVPLERQ